MGKHRPIDNIREEVLEQLYDLFSPEGDDWFFSSEPEEVNDSRGVGISFNTYCPESNTTYRHTLLTTEV